MSGLDVEAMRERAEGAIDWCNLSLAAEVARDTIRALAALGHLHGASVVRGDPQP